MYFTLLLTLFLLCSAAETEQYYYSLCLIQFQLQLACLHFFTLFTSLFILCFFIFYFLYLSYPLFPISLLFVLDFLYFLAFPLWILLFCYLCIPLGCISPFPSKSRDPFAAILLYFLTFYN